MFKARVFWLIVAALLAAYPGQAAAAACSEVVLGSVLSLTGRFSKGGALTRSGYEFAIRQIRRAGGIRVGDRCYNLRVIYYDDESAPKRAVPVAKRLIEKDHVQFMLGPNSAAVTDAIAATVESEHIPMLIPQGTPHTLYGDGRRYMFGMFTVDDDYLAGVLDLAAKVAHNTGRATSSVKLALIRADDPFSAVLRSGLLRRAVAHSMKIEVDEKLAVDLSNTISLLTKVRQAQPDVVVVAGDGKAALTVARQIDDLEVHAPIVAMTSCEAAGLAAKSAVARNLLCAARARAPGFGGGSWVTDFRAFEKAFKAFTKSKTGRPVSDVAAQAALAVYVFADALRRAGTRDSEMVRDAIATTDFDTFYGHLRFGPAGNAVSGPAMWRQIQNGRYRVVAPATRATHNFEWPRGGL